VETDSQQHIRRQPLHTRTSKLYSPKFRLPIESDTKHSLSPHILIRESGKKNVDGIIITRLLIICTL